jgi:hypothetical protein
VHSLEDSAYVFQRSCAYTQEKQMGFEENMMPCILTEVQQRLEGTYCLFLQSQGVSQACKSNKQAANRALLASW